MSKPAQHVHGVAAGMFSNTRRTILYACVIVEWVTLGIGTFETLNLLLPLPGWYTGECMDITNQKNIPMDIKIVKPLIF